MNNALHFANAGDERGTPQEFFDKLNAEFHFTLDAAASALNHKCDDYFGDQGLAYDALEQDWGGHGSVVFLNPPYSVAGAFVQHARAEADKGALVILVLPVRSDTKWWHSNVWDVTQGVDGHWRPGVRCRLLPGRLNFELHVTDELRLWIKQEIRALDMLPTVDARADALVTLVKTTGLPRMAINRIGQDMPDDCLLDSAPFPSCVVIFSQVPQ